MKKVFYAFIVNAILVATLTTGLAQSPAREKEQKQRVKIVVVEKREKPGGDSQPKRSPETRGKRS